MVTMIFPFVIATSKPGCGVAAEHNVAQRSQMAVRPRAATGRVLTNMLWLSRDVSCTNASFTTAVDRYRLYSCSVSLDDKCIVSRFHRFWKHARVELYSAPPVA